MLDGGLSTYIPMCLYGYIAIRLCVYKCTSGACFRLPGYCPGAANDSLCRGVRSGRRCLSAHPCGRAGLCRRGGSALGSSAPLWRARMPSLVMRLPPCVATRVWGSGDTNGWVFFLYVFSGFSSLCSVSSSRVVSQLFLPFWFALVGVQVGQWGV